MILDKYEYVKIFVTKLYLTCKGIACWKTVGEEEIMRTLGLLGGLAAKFMCRSLSEW